MSSLDRQQVLADLTQGFFNDLCLSFVEDMFACCVIECAKRALSVTLDVSLNVPMEHEVLIAGE
jgi:hypothetical protein